MTTEHLTCKTCAASFQWENDGSDFSDILRPDLCPKCHDELYAKREAEQLAEQEAKIEDELLRFRNKITAAVPPLFRLTDTAHPRFNARAWEKIRQWTPTAERPFAGLCGGTGGSKTRISYLLASKRLEDTARDQIRDYGPGRSRLPTFHFVPSYDLSEMALRQFTGDGGNSRSLLDSIRKCDLLLLDDLGKGRLSPAAAAEMFAVIDCRYANLKTTIWTSNSPPEKIFEHLPEDMAAPFAGRLNEASKIYKFA